MVSLERGTALSLRKDNSRINDLVELGQVEEVSVERKTLIPHPATLETRDRRPRRGGGRVGDCVFGARGAVHLAQRVDDADETVGAVDGRDGAGEAGVHADEGPGGVDGEEDVMEDDEPAEGGGL